MDFKTVGVFTKMPQNLTALYIYSLFFDTVQHIFSKNSFETTAVAVVVMCIAQPEAVSLVMDLRRED
jgi:hypothetical protein